MDEKNWRKRFKYRVDLSSRVTHLTKGETAEEAFRNLINILEERRIRGSKTSSGFICGETPAVCLQEAPLTAIAENLQYEEKLRKEENHKVRYLGFGIRFQKNFIYAYGHFPRPSGPRSPARQGHIKRPVLRLAEPSFLRPANQCC